MRFIHIADVHLGVLPDAGKPWSEKRKTDIWTAFTEVFAVAERMKVDLVLISGDLFHRQPLVKELREINYIFEQVPRIRIVITAGNHDFLSISSNYRNFSFAKNVVFLKKNEVDSVYFPDINTEVYGKSYWRREETALSYNDVIPKRNDAINILMAHGGDAKHLPFCPEKILENGFDYLAAGHIHMGGVLKGKNVQPKPLVDSKKITTAKAVMAGALQPIDSGDTGEHGFWIGEMTKHFSQVQFCPIKRCQYVHETIQVSSHMTNMAVQTIVKNLLVNRKPYELYKIFLKGSLNSDTEIDLEWIRQQEAVVDVVSCLKTDYDYEKLKNENQDMLLGRFITAMQSQGDSQIYHKALEVGVEALLSSRTDI